MKTAVLPNLALTATTLERLTNQELLREVYRITAQPTPTELELAKRLDDCLGEMSVMQFHINQLNQE